MTLINQLNTLESSDLIRLAQAQPEVEYLFRHALIQDAAYASLVKHDRQQLHRAVGEALERTYPDQLSSRELAPSLANHYWHGGDWPKAANYSMRAGAGAMSVYALREAIGHYERALQALEKSPDAPPVQMYDATMGWIQAATKFRPYAEQLRRLAHAEQIARELNDKPRLAQALYWTGNAHRASGYNIRAAPPLLECYHLAEEIGDEKLAMIPTYYMALVTLDADPRSALALFDRAIELARKYDDKDIEAYALATKAMAEARLGQFLQSQRNIQGALGAVGEAKVRSPMTESDVNLYAGWSYLDMGDVQRGLAYGQRGLDTAIAADNMDCICYGFACLGFGHLQAQKLPEAINAFEEAIRRSQFSGAAQVENLGRSGLAIAQFFSGRPDAIQDMETALAKAQALGDQLGAALVSQTLGEILTHSSELDRALNYLNAALDYYRRAELCPYLARGLQSLAAVYEQQGDTPEAERARSEAAAFTHERMEDSR